MPIEITLAKLSPTMESGQLVKWLVKVGDAVKEGDTLAEVQTDKAVMNMESFEDGVVALLDVAEGDELALGQRVLVLAKKGEDPKAIAASHGGKATSTATAKATSASSTTVSAAVPSQASHGEINGQEREPADELVAAQPGSRVRSTPLARKVAAAAGVDLRRVPPSGPAGRIVRSDVEAFMRSAGAATPASMGTTAASVPSTSTVPSTTTTTARPAPTPPIPAGAVQRIPLGPMRKTIAARMVEAKRVAPDIHLTVDVLLDQVVMIRERLNKKLQPEKIKLSIGDFVTKGVALALRAHPAMNASFENDSILKYGDVNVGIAVALDNGLIVPVLHRADTLGLRDIRLGTEKLADAARGNKLTGDQLSGGTFTISNLGMYGIKQFDAILNLPQVGILAVGAAEKRPVVKGDSLGVGTVMSMTLTADHRAVDGATAAAFLRDLRELLEEPSSMLL